MLKKIMMKENLVKEAKKKNIKRRNIRESIRLLVRDLNHKRRENSRVNESAHVLIRNLRKVEEENILLRNLGRNIIGKMKNHQRKMIVNLERESIHHRLPQSIEGIKIIILSVLSKRILNLQVHSKHLEKLIKKIKNLIQKNHKATKLLTKHLLLQFLHQDLAGRNSPSMH